MQQSDSVKRVVGVAAVALVALGGEALADSGYADGSTVQNSGYCAITQMYQPTTQTRVGYYVDTALGIPKIGVPTVIHAVVTSVDTCTLGDADDPGLELILPAGVHIDPSYEAQCFLESVKGKQDQPYSCIKHPVLDQRTGRYYLGGQTDLAPGWSLEIQVPVVFDQAFTGQEIQLLTTSGFGNMVSKVAVFAPYQAPTLPTPMTMTIPPPTVTKAPMQPSPPEYIYGDDLAFLGTAGTGTTLPIAFTNGDGSFVVTNYQVGMFADWARTPGVKRLAGDFNDDGRTDYALLGVAGWQSIPVATSLGNGSFSVTNQAVTDNFSSLAALPHVNALTGDFNGDGKTDIALVGGIGWASIPVAFGAGAGAFTVHNEVAPLFASMASQGPAKPHVGDFNRDGNDDIALTGGAGWASIPIAFCNGSNGTFLITNKPALVMPPPGSGNALWNFAELASQPGVTVIAADFDLDGRADLALAGGQGWTGIPLAVGYGDGSFLFMHKPAGPIAGWASSPGAKVLGGDFNRDGYTDLAITGVVGWQSIPVALNIGFGNFVPANNLNSAFAARAAEMGARPITGDFNGDGLTDIALIGGTGWLTIPMAFCTDNGDFTTYDRTNATLAGWAGEANASTLVGPVN